jgi:hypothetical protein
MLSLSAKKHCTEHKMVPKNESRNYTQEKSNSMRHTTDSPDKHVI